MKTTVRDILSCALVVSIGLLTVFSPFFPLIRLDSPLYPGMSECGFDLVSMNSPYFFAEYNDVELVSLNVIFIGILSLIMSVFGIIVTVAGVLGIFKQKFRAAWKGLFVAAFVLLCVYALSGILYLLYYVDISRNDVATSAHLAAVYGLVLLVAFGFCRSVFAEEK